MRRLRLVLPAAVALLAAGTGFAACSASPTGSVAAPAVPSLERLPTGDQTADQATLDSARRAIRTLAAPGQCAGGACASLPVGAKACGGPSEYVAYCPTSPDAARLRALAADVTRAEHAFNERYGIGSTCNITPAIQGCPVAP